MTNTKSTFVRKIKRMSRKAPVRIVALVLMVALIMNVSSVVTLLPVFAENNTATTVQGDSPTATVTNDDLQISGSNSFGNLLATKVNDYQNSGNEDEYTEGYSVIGIEMNGKSATVEYNALENCTLVVGVYTEDGVKMLGSGNATVSSDSQSADVEISISEMPQYYLVKAFLVNPANNYPLCKVYTCELYTKSIQEVIESTVEDYPDREILNLDGDNATNFAVYGLGVNVIKQSEGKNTYLAGDSNPNSGKYVFANADSEFASLKVGDIFSHERGAEVIIAKVKSIEAIPNGDGTYTLTIFEDNNIDMEDVFDYVKIENNGKINSYTIDDSVADECVKTPSGSSQAPSSGSANGSFSKTVTPKEYNTVDISPEFDPIIIERELVSKKGSTNSNAQHSDEDDPIVANVDFSIKLKLTVRISLKVYLSSSDCYLEYKTGIDASLNGTINGVITVNPFTICKVVASPVPGVFITFEPKPEFSASASLTLNLTFTQSAGFKCSTKSGLSKIDSQPQFIPKVGIEGKLFFGINFKPELSIISNKVAEASMTAKVGGEMVGKRNFIDSTSESDSQKHDCEYCVDGDFNFIFELSATVKFLKSEKLTYSQKIIPKIKIKIGDWYWSVDHDEFGLGTCPYISYKVTLTIRNSDSQPASDVSIYDSADMSKELAKTDENGKAEFYLPNGDYILKARKDQLELDTIEITIEDSKITKEITLAEDKVVDTGKCGENITYTLYGDGRLLLSGSGAMWDYDNRENVPWNNSRSNIKAVGFDGNITHIGNRIFGDCSNLTTISIPNTVTSIGDAVFSECTGLTELTIPDSVTSIGTAAFSDCRGLTNITVPYFATNIGDFVFGNCSGLTQAIIQSSSPTIKKMMFANCSSLKAVYIPKTVTSIGDSAFLKCDNLTDVYYSGSQSEWNNISISNMNNSALINATLHCSGTDNGVVIETGKCGDNITYTLYKNGLLELSGSGEMYNYTFSGGAPWNTRTKIKTVLINGNITSIGNHAFFTCEYLTNITIPNSVTYIGDGAFRKCNSLTSITIPNSVTYIGNCAFCDSPSLKSITIPNSVTYIGNYAFTYCSSLKSITILASVTSIGEYAFYGCYFLTSITIPKSVTSIGECTFYNCNDLTSITISNSVTSIGIFAFENCNNLTDVYYTGSQEEWERISIERIGNSCLTNATIYYNSTGPSSSPTPMLSPDVSGALTSTFDNLIPNENYLFVVSKSSDLDNMLDAENLLFIDEKTAGDSGSLTFSYIPREDYEGTVVKIFGPVNPSVTLDKTSATLKKSEKLTLTATVDQEHSANDVVWSSSNDKIATVSKGQVTAVGFGDAEISAKLDDCVVKCVVSVVPDLDITILGASIRLSEPYGIRFGIQLGKGGDYTNVKIVEYGTLMKPTQLLGDEELTLQTAKIQKIPSTVTYSETDAALVYTGVLINIPTTYFDTAVSGRGYFIYEDENGVNHTIYTDTVSMSFNDVVEAAYNKYSKLSNPTDAQKVVLQKLEKLRALNGNN